MPQQVPLERRCENQMPLVANSHVIYEEILALQEVNVQLK